MIGFVKMFNTFTESQPVEKQAILFSLWFFKGQHIAIFASGLSK